MPRVGVTVTMPLTFESVLFDPAVNADGIPEPFAAMPVAVLLFTQEKVVEGSFGLSEYVGAGTLCPGHVRGGEVRVIVG